MIYSGAKHRPEISDTANEFLASVILAASGNRENSEMRKKYRIRGCSPADWPGEETRTCPMQLAQKHIHSGARVAAE